MINIISICNWAKRIRHAICSGWHFISVLEYFPNIINHTRSWYEGNPCNMHLLDLSKLVKKGVMDAGLVGYRFNTIGVSDGISMGTSGMSYSLQSREIIAGISTYTFYL